MNCWGLPILGNNSCAQLSARNSSHRGKGTRPRHWQGFCNPNGEISFSQLAPGIFFPIITLAKREREREDAHSNHGQIGFFESNGSPILKGNAYSPYPNLSRQASGLCLWCRTYKAPCPWVLAYLLSRLHTPLPLTSLVYLSLSLLPLPRPYSLYPPWPLCVCCSPPGMLFCITNSSLSSTLVSQPPRRTVLWRPSWVVPTLSSSRAESSKDGLSVQSSGPPFFLKFSWYLATHSFTQSLWLVSCRNDRAGQLWQRPQGLWAKNTYYLVLGKSLVKILDKSSVKVLGGSLLTPCP